MKLFLSSPPETDIASRSQKWWWLSNLKNWSKPPSLVSILDKNRQKILPDKISLAGILSEFWIFFRNIGPDCFTLKFGLSEKHTKCFGCLLSKCPKHEEDCANFCVLLRKYELYIRFTYTTFFRVFECLVNLVEYFGTFWPWKGTWKALEKRESFFCQKEQMSHFFLTFWSIHFL